MQGRVYNGNLGHNCYCVMDSVVLYLCFYTRLTIEYLVLITINLFRFNTYGLNAIVENTSEPTLVKN